MKRHGLTLNLKPDLVAVYREHHRRVWPEVEAGLRGIGIQEMTIFILGNRLFMLVDTNDEFEWETGFQGYLAEGRCAAWQKLMNGFQEPVPEAREGEWWAAMEEVYHLPLSPEIPIGT